MLRFLTGAVDSVFRKDLGEAVGVCSVIISLHDIHAEILPDREYLDRDTAA